MRGEGSSVRSAWTALALVVLFAGCGDASITDAGAQDSGHVTLDGGIDAGSDRAVPGLPDPLHDELVSMCKTFHQSRCAALRDFHAGSVVFDECVAVGAAKCTGGILGKADRRSACHSRMVHRLGAPTGAVGYTSPSRSLQ